ncbi:hypothetical protein H1R20_g12562, partial [Candolleomyces eurysporus]
MKLSAAALTILTTFLAFKLAFVSVIPMPSAEDDIDLSVEMRDVDNGTKDVWAGDVYVQLLDEIYSRGTDDDDFLLYAHSPMLILAKNAGTRKL